MLRPERHGFANPFSCSPQPVIANSVALRISDFFYLDEVLGSLSRITGGIESLNW